MMSSAISISDNILQPLLIISNSSALDEALERLIEIARSADGRSDFASMDILATVLKLCHSLLDLDPSCSQTLLLSLKLLRNLCAGELRNQNSFIELDGVKIVSTIISSNVLAPELDYGIIRMGLQLLGNVSLAGEKHQQAIWKQLFPLQFVEIAKLQRKDICDPLCMVMYHCLEGTHDSVSELKFGNGLAILVEIVRTASAVGFREDWLKRLLSRTCVEEYLFSTLFTKLWAPDASGNSNVSLLRLSDYTLEQSFLLSILSEILNEALGEVIISNGFALEVLEVFRSALQSVSFASRPKSGLPTGSTDIDVLGYSLTILRDICACDDVSADVMDSLLSSGLLELLLDTLHSLEPPAIIRKAMKEASSSRPCKPCPYKGFRRDIVGVIGNLAYGKKHVQDCIREKNGLLLMLQQCVTDEDNPFLREWGIWSVRNLLEGNVENQRVVSELELQGSVDVPELTGLGLRVEVDQNTRRAKLVNVINLRDAIL